MTRTRAIIYAALTAVEVAYVLWTNLPTLWPSPPCPRPGIYDVCVLMVPVFPWLWIALATLLLLSAVAILLRKEAGISTGFVGQALLVTPFVRDTFNDVNSFLFTGEGWSGIDPSFRHLAVMVLALAVVIGPAFAVLLLMTVRLTVANGTAARVASLLVTAQLIVLVAVAIIAFRVTYQDCLNNGPGTPVIDGVPGCPDYADLDIGSLVATIVPSAGILAMVCVGLWRCRPWAFAGGFVWQLLLVVVLGAMGVALRTDASQNAWYDHFPPWTSPRELAYALIVIVAAPALAAMLATFHVDVVVPREASRTS